jgi:hypothetical protein
MNTQPQQQQRPPARIVIVDDPTGPASRHALAQIIAAAAMRRGVKLVKAE